VDEVGKEVIYFFPNADRKDKKRSGEQGGKKQKGDQKWNLED
jgi:hypothetical protein